MAPGLYLAGDVTRTLQEKRKALPSSEAARLSLRQMANAPYRFSGPIEGDETVGQSSVGLDILLEDEHVAPSRNPGIKISRRHKKARKLAPTARRLRARLGVSARIGIATARCAASRSGAPAALSRLAAATEVLTRHSL